MSPASKPGALRPLEVAPCHERAFLVHLIGGGCVKMMLEARDLSDVQHALQHQRVLIGRHVFESEIGLEESMPALIPTSRIQMVIEHER